MQAGVLHASQLAIYPRESAQTERALMFYLSVRAGSKGACGEMRRKEIAESLPELLS
jgi:hypothetical protein